MYQFNNLTSNVPNVQTFNGNGGAWESWTKPNDALLIHILCIGGGAGGGSGRPDSGANNKYGGGGGGSAAVTSMYVPAFLIPDTLYVQVGLGGAGGAAQTVNATDGNIGGNCSVSYVALYPDATLSSGSVFGNLLLASARTGGTQGGGGGTATSGNGGTGQATLAIGGSPTPFYIGLGQFTTVNGQAGSSSAIAASPTALTISGITCGGAAGGGVQNSPLNTAAGGAINSPSALIPYLTSLSGGAANSTDSSVINSGYAVKKPLMFIGGAGSGAKYATAATSKNGGNGAIGSGGGGSGAAGGLGGAFVTGAGGKGGDGIVIITSYSI